MIDINATSNAPSVFVYGTTTPFNPILAEALADHFDVSVVIHGWTPDLQFDQTGCLILCNTDPRKALTLEQLGGCMIHSLDAALNMANLPRLAAPPQQPAAKGVEHHAGVAVELNGPPGRAARQMWQAFKAPTLAALNHMPDPLSKLCFWSGFMHGVMETIADDIGVEDAQAMAQHFATDCDFLLSRLEGVINHRPAGHQVH